MKSLTSTDKRLIKLYSEMSDLTSPECKCTCRVPYGCCSPEHCEITIQWAMERWGIELRRVNGLGTRGDILPLLGHNGCTAEPHLRPLCTVHTCAINSLGYKRGDQNWTEKYFKLRNKLEALEL